MKYSNLVKTIIIFLICFLTFSNADAQKGKRIKIDVCSVVKNAKGQPIPDVTVYGNEGAVISKTDGEGKFCIKISAGTSRLLEAKGYKSTVVDYTDEQVIVMEEEEYMYSNNDLLSVPFGKEYKGDIAHSVSNIKSEDILADDHVESVWDIIRARVPGLIGNDNIRGLGNSLVIVDGFPRDLSSLNTEEIEQVSVLKDATAVALYGTQARDGVILITTKRGEAHKRIINLNVEKGFSLPRALPEYLGSAEYMQLYNEALRNDGLSPRYDDIQISNYSDGLNPYRYPDVDYYGKDFLKNLRNTTKVVAEFSGGNKNTQYYTNLGWVNEESLIKSEKRGAMNKFNIRGNIDFSLGKYIRSHLDAVVIIRTEKNPNGNFWQNAASLHPYYFSPLLPISLITDEALYETAKKIDDKYILGGTTQYQDNVYGNLYLSGYSQNIYRTSQFNGGFDVDLSPVLKGLTFKSLLSFDFYNRYNQNVTNKYAVYAPTWDDEGNIVNISKIGEDVSNGVQNLGSGNLTRRIGFYGLFDYKNTFANVHNLNAQLIGYTYQLHQDGVLLSHKDNHLALHLAYNYARRYYVDFAAVMAHSVKLPKNKRQGISPSATVAWVVSNEDFWNKNSFIDYLKLHAGGGVILTDMGIGTHIYDESYWYDASFAWGEGFYSGNTTKAGRTANPNLYYEKMHNYTFGVEAAMLKHSLKLEVQAFYNKYSDQVLRRYNYYPAFNSVFFPDENYEATSYKGIEAGLSYEKTFGEFSVKVGANMLWRNSNVVKRDELWQNQYQYRAGHPTDAMFGYVCKGFFKDYNDIENSPRQMFGEVRPGDLKYEDLNNDGIIDTNDQKMIGNSLARLSGGINLTLKYRNITFFAIAETRTGYDYYQNSSYFWIDGNDKYSEIVRDRWTPETANTATYPRLSSKTNDNNFRNSTFWLNKGNYISLSRMQLTYTFPYSLIHHLPIKNASIYLRGSNLFMISSNSRLRVMNIASEPQYKNIVMGINLMF